MERLPRVEEPCPNGRGEGDSFRMDRGPDTPPAEPALAFSTAGATAGGGVGCLFALGPALLAHLADHAGPADCPLPDLFRALAVNQPLTIGEFHDCLRQLHADGAVSFTAWAGPLYALPEPQYALLIGHGIAYYASLRG